MLYTISQRFVDEATTKTFETLDSLLETRKDDVCLVQLNTKEQGKRKNTEEGLLKLSLTGSGWETDDKDVWTHKNSNVRFKFMNWNLRRAMVISKENNNG